jgi:hypothetical protein
MQGFGRLAVERAEARSATMADSEKNCDFGHARGDIAEQVVGFRRPLMALLKALLPCYNMNYPQGTHKHIASNQASLPANLTQCGAISVPQGPCMG